MTRVLPYCFFKFFLFVLKVDFNFLFTHSHDLFSSLWSLYCSERQTMSKAKKRPMLDSDSDESDSDSEEVCKGKHSTEINHKKLFNGFVLGS